MHQLGTTRESRPERGGKNTDPNTIIQRLMRNGRYSEAIEKTVSVIGRPHEAKKLDAKIVRRLVKEMDDQIDTSVTAERRSTLVAFLERKGINLCARDGTKRRSHRDHARATRLVRNGSSIEIDLATFFEDRDAPASAK